MTINYVQVDSQWNTWKVFPFLFLVLFVGYKEIPSNESFLNKSSSCFSLNCESKIQVILKLDEKHQAFNYLRFLDQQKIKFTSFSENDVKM